MCAGAAGRSSSSKRLVDVETAGGALSEGAPALLFAATLPDFSVVALPPMSLPKTPVALSSNSPPERGSNKHSSREAIPEDKKEIRNTRGTAGVRGILVQTSGTRVHKSTRVRRTRVPVSFFYFSANRELEYSTVLSYCTKYHVLLLYTVPRTPKLIR